MTHTLFPNQNTKTTTNNYRSSIYSIFDPLLNEKKTSRNGVYKNGYRATIEISQHTSIFKPNCYLKVHNAHLTLARSLKSLFTVRNEVAKVMFLHVSVCPQGGSAPVHAGIHPPPNPDQRQTPPGPKADTPGPKADTPSGPKADTPQTKSRHPSARWLLLRTVRILLECILVFFCNQTAGLNMTIVVHFSWLLRTPSAANQILSTIVAPFYPYLTFYLINIHIPL